jgi:hypothetical protein
MAVLALLVAPFVGSFVDAVIDRLPVMGPDRRTTELPRPSI